MTVSPHDIILRPIITERGTDLQQLAAPQYLFQVAPKANKIQIRAAVEELFKVRVANVNTLLRKGKVKRVRARAGRRPTIKRAIVTLEPGQKIEMF